MFERFTEPSTLSPTEGGPVAGLAVVLSAGAALGLIPGLWRWAATSQFPEAQLLMGPFWALLLWERVEHQWSATKRRLLVRVEIVLACIFAVGFAYGLQAWIWAHGDPWLPWASFLYMLLPFGTMRRHERLPPDDPQSGTPPTTSDVSALETSAPIHWKQGSPSDTQREASTRGEPVLRDAMALDEAMDTKRTKRGRFIPAGNPGTSLPPAGPDRRLRWNLAALYGPLDEGRRQRGLSWAQLAAELRCSPHQLTRIRTARFAIGMRLAMRIVQWLRQPASGFIYAAAW